MYDLSATNFLESITTLFESQLFISLLVALIVVLVVHLQIIKILRPLINNFVDYFINECNQSFYTNCFSLVFKSSTACGLALSC